MPLFYSFPSSHYNVWLEGTPADEIEIEDVVPPAQQGVQSEAELRLDVNSQVFTNVRVTITPSRQALVPPHTVTPEPGQWSITAAAPPSVVFQRLLVPAGGVPISFKVRFQGTMAANVVFAYRIEADQLSEPVEQYVIVAVA
jgi:hypothetical protein